MIAEAQYTNSIKFTVALKDGVTADSATFFSGKGYQCWSADPKQITFLCNADDVSKGKIGMKAYIEETMASYAKANGKAPSDLFNPVDASTVALTSPGKNPCYASPAPGQLNALDKLRSSMDSLAANGVGVAGTFLPHRSTEGLGIGFMECGLYSAQHACDVVLKKEKAQETWVHKVQSQAHTAAVAAEQQNSLAI